MPWTNEQDEGRDTLDESLRNMHRFSLSPPRQRHSMVMPAADDRRQSRGSFTSTTTPSLISLSLNDDDQELDRNGIAGSSFHGQCPPIKHKRTSTRPRSYVVISGGTAANDFVHAFGTDCAFVLPGK